MIKSIQLCLTHSGRVDGRKHVAFSPGLNTVVGPNGSGKSSLLKAIYDCPDCKKKNNDETRYHYFDSEAMNPHRSEEHFKGIAGSVIRVRAMFSSHGETMRDVLRFMNFKPGDCLLLDEPEAGHDLKWIIKIRKGLDKIAQTGCQVIVASHHPVFFNDMNIIELKRDYVNKTLEKFKRVVCG
ncbi:MAG: AAA family ATPase [Candidatus Omnitrophica bacterium]|nr:AAA family ATPase [Candidatus Omnitrophota bacterium]